MKEKTKHFPFVTGLVIILDDSLAENNRGRLRHCDMNRK